MVLLQFFITMGESLDYLDNVHTVFGEVAEGLDVLMKINEAYCDKEHRPYKDIRYYCKTYCMQSNYNVLTVFVVFAFIALDQSVRLTII